MKFEKRSIIVLSILFFVSCRSSLPIVPEVPVRTVTKVVERLVPFQAPADSANIAALFECDSLNRVILKRLSESKSKQVSSQLQVVDGFLTYGMKVKPDISYARAKDSVIYKDIIVRTPVEVKTNYLTKWQILQMWGGRILAALIILLIVYQLLKSKIKLKI